MTAWLGDWLQRSPFAKSHKTDTMKCTLQVYSASAEAGPKMMDLVELASCGDISFYFDYFTSKFYASLWLMYSILTIHLRPLP